MIKSSLVKLEIGDKVLYESGRYGIIKLTLKSIILTPNESYDPKLVAIITAYDKEGNYYQATSDKFFAAEDEDYKEFYPSVHLIHINDKKKNLKTLFNFLFNRWTK